jgi:AcrR family transcriptional regulator
MLMWRQGYPATGMKQIVQQAQAPFGSVYHFFPGGKEELGAEAVRWSGGFYGDLVDAHFDAAIQAGHDLPTALRTVFTDAGRALAANEFADACPVATVALEMSSVSEPIRRACSDVFRDWADRLANRFETAGVGADAARALATAFLMLLEGAFVLARAHRSVEPLNTAGQVMAATTQAALAA